MSSDGALGPPFHLIFSASAAGTLRQTLSSIGRTDPIACLHDDLSFGPIDTEDDASRVAWVERELGFDGWGDIKENRAFILEACRSSRAPLIVWVTRRNAHEFAGYLWWLSCTADREWKVMDLTDCRRLG